jgi:hypothetical protein
MKIKEFLKLSKGKIFFFVLGCIFALAWEQQGWWKFIIFNRGEFHNDWWMLISEDIKPWEESGILKVLYSTRSQQALLVYNIWTIILSIASALILLSILISIYMRVRK